jgi:hypothetical protein
MPGTVYPPLVPALGTVAAGNASVSAAWSAPSSDGGSAVTGYVLRVLKGATVAKTVTLAASARSATVTGLVNGTGYTVSIAAKNLKGTGAASVPSDVVTPVGPPAAPRLAATPGDQTAALKWTAPAANGSPITGYTLDVAAGGTLLSTASLGAGATSAALSGLTNGTAYTVTMTATNAIGISPLSAKVLVTPRTLPGTPTLDGVTAGAGSAVVRWAAPSSTGGLAISGYVITAYRNGVHAKTVTAGGTARSFTVTGLVNGADHTFRIAAKTAAGTGTATAPSSVVTPRGAPTAPRTPVATPGSASARVTWVAPLSDGGSAVTGYTVRAYRGTALVSTVTVGGSTLETTFTGLTSGIGHTFSVTATNAIGTSPASLRTRSVLPTA